MQPRAATRPENVIETFVLGAVGLALIGYLVYILLHADRY
jgi:hypothetical protein